MFVFELNNLYKRLMKYNWQFPEWPEFHYEIAGVQDLILKFIEKTGRTDGLLSTLPETEKTETIIDLMVSEALTSAAIEGEMLSRPDVMSSIKKNLGLHAKPEKTGDQRAEGIAELLVCVRNSFKKPLSKEMLFNWHSMLMKGAVKIQVGTWRTHKEPMLIVSGSIGNETVHFEAPPSTAVPAEIKRFISWFNRTDKTIQSFPVKAAIAHLYFESIHPFEDGNGRIGRALSEKALSQGFGYPVLLSLSQAIETDRTGYYAALKQAQRSLNATEWIEWFVRTLITAQQQAETQIEFAVRKTKFYTRINGMKLNERQLKVLHRMLKEGSNGFQGGMSAKKYMVIAKTSKPTATRDLQALVEYGVLISSGGGRSTNYQISL
ncbi:MAG: Fic family protein [Kiritimatiellales bacterium]